MEAIGYNIRVWVNGIQTADLMDDMTAFGFIALQVHSIGNESRAGKEIHCKNIGVKTENLDAEKSPNSKDVPQVSFRNNRLSEREIEEGHILLQDHGDAVSFKNIKIKTL